MTPLEIIEQLRRTLLPVDHEMQLPPPGTRCAAVVIVLYARNGEVCFLLTERSSALRRHSGQIALPGGAVEEGDTSAYAAALREAQEELSLRTGRFRALGRLPERRVRLGDFLVSPFVVWSPVPPRWRADPAEVASVIEVPLSAITETPTIVRKAWELGGGRYHVTFYRLKEVVVWGITAGILYELSVALGFPPMPAPPGTVTRAD